MKPSKYYLKFLPVFLLCTLALSNNARPQLATPNPVCYGQPIYLFCSLSGCEVPGATFAWSNYSGSWTSNEFAPVIYPGEAGYASDMFYLVVEYGPPPTERSEGTVIINLLPQFNSTGTPTNVQCCGSLTGAVYITASGGGIPYRYEWSNGSTVRNQTGLCAGTYTVTVTDCFDCSQTTFFEITEPQLPLLFSSALVTNVDCAGSYNGAIDLSLAGGSSSNSFFWSTGENTEDIDSLIAGAYTVTVTDANGCTLSGSWIVAGECEPVCYGEPIYLFCTLTGCEVPGATFQWTNSTGSWTSGEMNPVLFPGTAGYATDIFYLNLQFMPPPGGFSTGAYSVKVSDCSGISAAQEQVFGDNDGNIFIPVSESESLKSMMTGQEKSNEYFYKVYPNPSNGIFTLDLTEMKTFQPLRVEIYNLRSEMIYSSQIAPRQKHTLSLSDRANGIYLLRVFTTGKSSQVKIIKQ
ncbi:MAG: T9SS type A sorting domain-containing protein [Bacteroidales bacterium]|nr:T9SS type A sorting domain-containing protein [Bacteroidales bacterium]